MDFVSEETIYCSFVITSLKCKILASFPLFLAMTNILLESSLNEGENWRLHLSGRGNDPVRWNPSLRSLISLKANSHRGPPNSIVRGLSRRGFLPAASPGTDKDGRSYLDCSQRTGWLRGGWAGWLRGGWAGHSPFSTLCAKNNLGNGKTWSFLQKIAEAKC